MRLIDADKLLYEDVECTDGATYLVVHAPYIDNAPTAFDFESVIEKLENKALEHALNGQQYGKDGFDIFEREEQGIKKGIEIALEILKSAAGEFAEARNNRIEKTTHPDCFTPEENVAYPLCIGKNFPKCEICNLRASFEPDDAYGIE